MSSDFSISEIAIQRGVRRVADEINRDYHNKIITAICVLKGASIFFADLVRRINVPLIMEFVHISSYGDQRKSNHRPLMHFGFMNETSIRDNDILIVEDIVDTGVTMSTLLESLNTLNPKGIAICTLLDEPNHRIKEVPLKYIGFNVPKDVFVSGYGLDDKGFDRNQRDIYSLPPEK